MPESYFRLSARDKADALNAASAVSGRPPHLLEKDIWVVWSLAVLFESQFGSHLVFKGGTALSKVEGALRGLPEGSCLYQYTRVMSGFDLPRQKQYSNEVTEAFASDRLDKIASFRRIDLHWCLTREPSQAKAFQRKPDKNVADTSRMLSDLEKTATLLEGHLGSSLGLRLLGKAEAFQFFSYLFNLEEWSGRDQLRADTGVDRQIVKSPVSWHSDHVQVGKRYVQRFSLKTTPEASRPCLFSGLLTLDCDSVVCSTWRVESTSAARSEIDAQEKFISFFKVGVLTRVMSGRDRPASVISIERRSQSKSLASASRSAL